MPSETMKPAVSPNLAATSTTGRRPGRPTQRILSVESIVDRTLKIAGREGFTAVTMNRLARDMGVTPRALYNHVLNRQEIIDRVWVRIIDDIELPDLEPEDWRGSVDTLWNALRDQFREAPRVLLIGLDEQISPQGTSPLRIAGAEKTLHFFTGIGLSLKEATIVREMMLADVFSFTLTSDYNYDNRPEEDRAGAFHPVPKPWLEQNPDVDAPLIYQAIEESVQSSDELFGYMVDARIAFIEKLLAAK
ncbi:TetR/AcrR family transcriptional regulator [Corynebacterium crudilactis]|uniref:TetR family transcriptional regulator n=1 Tax=Corynebacterium crudilactis TaxID=1652495 RepID=A0A172QVE2_9CORY|nr:TetR family transcriptional regulator [Corynebacterium crudilactis]ANE04674.1 TetR family transcriptional regulator [Corynebacterium crudilactis]